MANVLYFGQSVERCLSAPQNKHEDGAEDEDGANGVDDERDFFAEPAKVVTLVGVSSSGLFFSTVTERKSITSSMYTEASIARSLFCCLGHVYTQSVKSVGLDR
jgi:hypothetical protein